MVYTDHSVGTAVIGLQELRGMLEAQSKGSIRETLLQTLAAVGCRLPGLPQFRFTLTVILGRLDDADPAVRATAVQLLEGRLACLLRLLLQGADSVRERLSLVC